MPELAEVEFFRRQWNPGLNQPVRSVHLHPHSRVFRGTDTEALAAALTGSIFQHSQRHGKQMILRFGSRHWLGIRLGMTGKLRYETPDYPPGKADHLVLRQKNGSLVFSDPRQFGHVTYYSSETIPDTFSQLPPEILDDRFTFDGMMHFLKRRARSPIKAVLLMQEQFPGIGNWMADEILWRAAIHPAQAAGSLTPAQGKRLFKELREVARFALDTIGHNYEDPPESWLFPHRWKNGGRCPKTGGPLVRETIGGRTTCWSPGRQKLPNQDPPR